MTVEEDGQLMVHGLNMFPLKRPRIHLSQNFSQIFYCKSIQIIHVCGYRDTSFTKRRNMCVFKRENKAKTQNIPLCRGHSHDRVTPLLPSTQPVCPEALH